MKEPQDLSYPGWNLVGEANGEIVTKTNSSYLVVLSGWSGAWNLVREENTMFILRSAPWGMDQTTAGFQRVEQTCQQKEPS